MQKNSLSQNNHPRIKPKNSTLCNEASCIGLQIPIVIWISENTMYSLFIRWKIVTDSYRLVCHLTRDAFLGYEEIGNIIQLAATHVPHSHA